LIESLPLIPLQVDCRPKIARGQGVKGGAGVLIAEFEAGCIWSIPREISEKLPIDRSGVSAERRKLQEIEECGSLPRSRYALLQRSLSGLMGFMIRLPKVARSSQPWAD
jgi:hypothetical protein